MDFKNFYIELLNTIKKEKKLTFIVLGLFVFPLIAAFFMPNLFSNYQENLRNTLSRVDFNFLQAFIFILKNNIIASLLGLIPFFSFLYAIFNAYITGAFISSSFKVSQFGVIELILKVLPHGIFEIPGQILAFFSGALLTLSLFRKKIKESF